MEKTKKCPYCGEEIHIEAQKCKHCGEWLDKENTTVNESLFNEEIECGNEEVIEDEEPFVEKGFFGYYLERIWRFHKFDTNGSVSRSVLVLIGRTHQSVGVCCTVRILAIVAK